MQRFLMLAPMFAMLAIAGITDLRTRRIPNWLTGSLACAGMLQSVLGGSSIGPKAAILGMLSGFGLNVLLFALQIRGGGDVKLFAGVGAWIGPWLTVKVFVISTLIAAVMALTQAIAAGKLSPLLKNTGLLAVSLAHPKELGIAQVTREDGSFRSVGKPLPYAVPVIIATVIALIAV